MADKKSSGQAVRSRKVMTAGSAFCIKSRAANPPNGKQDNPVESFTETRPRK